MDNNTILGEAPIGKLMRGYAIPCIISLLVGALYNIVDQIFIANASYLGSYGPYLLGKLTNRCSAVGISPQPVGN